MENPRDDWRSCALEQRSNFADCYYREQREVDDSLNVRSQSPRVNAKSTNRAWQSRHGRKDRSDSISQDEEEENRKRRGHHRGRHGHKGGRQNRLQHVFLDGDDLEISGRHGHDQKFECRVNVDNDELKDEAMEVCCQQAVHGRVSDDRSSVSLNGVDA
jgi:hypothetical protein